MEIHEPPCKKIKLIEGQENVLIEKNIHMKKDVVLGEDEDKDSVKKKMLCIWMSISPYISTTLMQMNVSHS